MPDNAINKDKKKELPKEKSVQQAPRKSGFLKKIFKSLLYTFLSVIFLLFLVFVFIQTDIFNNWALDYITGKLNDSWKEKQSTIYAESLEGNIFKGIKLNNASVTVRQDTLIKFSYVEVKYNIFKLLNKEININDLTLQDPQINMDKVKGKNDSLQWNIEYLFSSDEEKEDTAKTEFDWDIIVDNFRINDGNFRILDSNLGGVPLRAFEMKKSEWFNPGNIDIKNFDLDLSARYQKQTKIFNLRNLNFNTNSDFNLKRLSFIAEINEKDTVTDLKNFVLVTDRTNLNIKSLYMSHFNPLNEVVYENFGNNDVKVDLITEKFSLKDLEYFLPELSFMNGTVSLELKTDGKYGKMNINKMVLKTPNSVYNFRGRIDNLNDPVKLNFDLIGENLIIDPADTKDILPGLPIPDYSHIGKVNADLSYSGEVLDFKTTFDVKSSFGNARGDFAMNLQSSDIRYSTKIEASGLNIGGVVKDKELESNLNISAELTGTGFDPNTMSAKVSYEMVNSRIMDENISKSAGIIDIQGSRIKGELSAATDNVQASVKGNVNLNNFSDAEYDAKGTVKNFDISKYTKNSGDKSSLNMAFDIRGKGLTFETIDGTFVMDIQKSYYAPYIIPPTAVKMKVNNIGSRNGYVSVSTDYFDMEARGIFNLSQIGGVMAYNIAVVADELKRKLNPDSASAKELAAVYSKNFSDLDFEYRFTAKNIEPLVSVFDTSGMQLIGSINGNVKNSRAGFYATAKLDIKNFIFQDTGITARNISGDLDFRNDYTKVVPLTESALYPLTANVILNGDYIRFGDYQFKNVNADLDLNESKQGFIFSARQDTTAETNFKGYTEFLKDSLRINVDTLYLRYNGFTIGNNGKLLVKYDPAPSKRTFTFEKFKISNDFMKFSALGDFSLSGSSDIMFETKNIKIAEIFELLSRKDSTLNNNKNSPLRGEIRRLSVAFKGTLDEPELNVEMNTGLIRYDNSKVGRIDAFIDYKNKFLNTDVLLSNAMGKGRLRLTGEAPLGPPKNGDTAVSFTDRDITIKLQADNFQINFFSKLVPDFADLRGLLDGEINAVGTVEEPKLSGGMDITKGRFFLGLTGMYHRFDTKLKTEGSDVVVEKFSVYNIDDYARHLDAWGRINIAGLTVNNIDLSTSGDVVVLDGSSEGTAFGFYGNMIAGMGDPPITITGNLKKLIVEGQLLIKSANLTFPTIPGASYDVYTDDFVYKVITDTSGTLYKDTTIIISPEDMHEVGPFMRTYVLSEEKTKPVSTNLIYNINVKTVKNAFVNVNINSLTQQQLLGEIKADLEVNNEINNQLQVLGDLDIVGDSYFRFYRNFKVDNSRVSFTGNPSNPYINIHAVYNTTSSGLKGVGKEENEQGVQIVLDITGTAAKPELKLRMFDNGQEVTGKDVQSDAISYLLFGVSKDKLKPGERSLLVQNIGATTGSAYLSGLLTGAIRNIAPFIIDTEINYTDGNLASGTDIKITSEIGDAIVKFGGKVFSGIDNTEVSIEYPLNKLLHMDLSNNLILEFSRTIEESTIEGSRSVQTGIKLVYKFKY